MDFLLEIGISESSAQSLLHTCNTQDIITIQGLSDLTESDFKELGLSIGHKSCIRKWQKNQMTPKEVDAPLEAKQLPLAEEMKRAEEEQRLTEVPERAKAGDESEAAPTRLRDSSSSSSSSSLPPSQKKNASPWSSFVPKTLIKEKPMTEDKIAQHFAQKATRSGRVPKKNKKYEDAA